MTQPTLFDTEPRPGKKLARKRGPETSKLAADAIAPRLAIRQARALTLVKAYPNSTQAELAKHDLRERIENLDENALVYDSRTVGRRLPDLQALGLVVRGGPGLPCSVTGRLAARWRVSALGAATR